MHGGYTLDCKDGPRLGVITVDIATSDNRGATWSVEHGTNGFRMLSGAGLFSTSRGQPTGQIWFGEIDHTSPTRGTQ